MSYLRALCLIMGKDKVLLMFNRKPTIRHKSPDIGNVELEGSE